MRQLKMENCYVTQPLLKKSLFNDDRKPEGGFSYPPQNKLVADKSVGHPV